MYALPASSAPFFRDIDLTEGAPVAPEFTSLVAASDTGRSNHDPSRIAALLKLPNGAIFWDAKLAVDADGMGGTLLDPEDGQDDTSFHFTDDSGRSTGPLNSTLHPFYVMPLGSFGAQTGLKLGDVGVCVYRNAVTGFLFGDMGPHDKLGEGSIALHDGLRPAAPDCCRRDANGRPTRIIDASIEHSVLVMAFPGSAFGARSDLDVALTPANLAVLVKERAYALFANMKGTVTPDATA